MALSVLPGISLAILAHWLPSGGDARAHSTSVIVTGMQTRHHLLQHALPCSQFS